MGKPEISQLISALKMLAVSWRDKASGNNRVGTSLRTLPHSLVTWELPCHRSNFHYFVIIKKGECVCVCARV